MAKIITEKKLKFDIPPGKKKERIDTFLCSHIENASRNKIQKLIKAEYVLVNGKTIKPNYVVNPDDVVDVTIPVSPRPENADPEDIPLDIVYEDEYLLIVNKAPGMVVHPAYGNYTGTMVNALLHHTQNLSEFNEADRPGIVHRIDKETSGILVVAKDEDTHAKLAKQFEKHTIERTYWAVCWGLFKERKGEIIKNIDRSNKDRKIFTTVDDERGKYAHTLYEVIDEFEFASLVKLNLKTGRTHQIRVHLNSINHPIFGDPTYNGRKIAYGATLPKMKQRVNNLLKIMERQALHAKTLGFIHPVTNEKVYYDSELPEDFSTLLEKLKV